MEPSAPVPGRRAVRRPFAQCGAQKWWLSRDRRSRDVRLRGSRSIERERCPESVQSAGHLALLRTDCGRLAGTSTYAIPPNPSHGVKTKFSAVRGTNVTCGTHGGNLGCEALLSTTICVKDVGANACKRARAHMTLIVPGTWQQEPVPACRRPHRRLPHRVGMKPDRAGCQSRSLLSDVVADERPRRQGCSEGAVPDGDRGLCGELVGCVGQVWRHDVRSAEAVQREGRDLAAMGAV